MSSESFRTLMGKIPVLPQQTYPKLKLFYKILILGATDSAWKGTFIINPPRMTTLNCIFTS